MLEETHHEVLKSRKGALQRRVDEICRLIIDGENSLVEIGVKAYRSGLPEEAMEKCFAAIEQAINEADSDFHRAKDAPTPTIGKARVVL